MKIAYIIGSMSSAPTAHFIDTDRRNTWNPANNRKSFSSLAEAIAYSDMIGYRICDPVSYQIIQSCLTYFRDYTVEELEKRIEMDKLFENRLRWQCSLLCEQKVIKNE